MKDESSKVAKKDKMKTDKKTTEICDVVVLGGALTAGVTCSILARQNISTIMLDSSCHPKFAIGEALVPESSFMFRLLSKRFDVPEIDSFSTHYNIVEKIAPTSGVKRSLSTIYHNDDGSYDVVQIPAISPPLGPDAHLFRQDTDAYICHTAAKYGTRILHNQDIDNIDISESGVVIDTDKGTVIKAKYVIDAGGQGSALAKHLDNRTESEFKTNSRAIFTHMVDVDFVDRHLPDQVSKNCDFLLSQGTLHHIFDGGWFWVIPFNNHSRSTNKLCSVGLVLDCNKYPYDGKDPEEEFFEFANKIDVLKRQLANAQSVRKWIGSKGKLQYGIEGSPIGHRYAMIGPAASFVDPLFSPGINTTLNFINSLMPKVINSVRKDDYCLSHYEDIVSDWQNTSMMWDKMIHASYISFRNSELWSTWFKLWNIFGFTGNVLITNVMLQFYAMKDKDILRRKNEYPLNGPFASRLEPCKEMFEEAYGAMLAVEDGSMSVAQAIDKLHMLMDQQTFFPFPEFHERSSTKMSLPNNTIFDLLKQVHTYRKELPEDIKPHLVGFSMSQMYWWAFKELSKIPFRKISHLYDYTTDALVPDKRFSKKMQDSCM